MSVVFLVTSTATIARQRRPYRIPTGLPKPRENWRVGTFASLLLHLGVVLLILTPFAATDDIRRMAQGAGGPGPAGGGGGGNRGSGGVPERVRFVRVAAPPPQPPANTETPLPVPTPVVVEPPKPVIQQLPELRAPASIPMASVATIGTGGTGSDNTGGQGPGSGGGVGSGIGIGRGSGMGPGTGGGNQENYPPEAIELALPPMPVPKGLQGDSVIVEFDVDATGRVMSLTFTDTGDRGYNRKLEDVLRTIKFRPGTTRDGRPIRMKTQIAYQF